MQTLLYDVRYALRQLRKTPGLTAARRSVPDTRHGRKYGDLYDDRECAACVRSLMRTPIDWFLSAPQATSRIRVYLVVELPGYRCPVEVLEYAAGYSEDVSVVEGKDGSQSVVAPRVTTNLFSMLGAHPLLGRTFTEAEGQTSGPPVALLSEGLWRQTFARRSAASLGR